MASYSRSVTGKADPYAALRDLEPEQWAAYLNENSGLPGPRANVPLVIAAALGANDEVINALLADSGEYPVMCAAAALARRALTPADEERTRALAVDQRWRVREGVAIGLQLLGDESPDALLPIILAWADDPHPLVERAAIAAICEPRLLRDPRAAAAAIDACSRATRNLVSTQERTTPDARTLRQALGYCWSVAVAADPEAGLPRFRELDVADPDIAWIVDQNIKKKRLSKLL